MLGIFTTSSDWALKKFLKFALKRSLGRYLQVEPDLDQLDVQLGTGRLELKNLLLNAANVNRDLVRAPRSAPRPDGHRVIGST